MLMTPTPTLTLADTVFAPNQFTDPWTKSLATKIVAALRYQPEPLGYADLVAIVTKAYNTLCDENDSVRGAYTDALIILLAHACMKPHHSER